MAQPPRLPPNRFVAVFRKARNSPSFSECCNFITSATLAGALISIALTRAEYRNFDMPCNRSALKDCFTHQYLYREVGLFLHNLGNMGAPLFACIQFLPCIRREFLLLHRLNGYSVLWFSLVGTIGTLMIARGLFGGGLDVQAALGLNGILFVGALVLAYVQIKRLQIDQHRAWMIRAWFYAGSIITVRIIMVCAATIISNIGTYYAARPCREVASAIGDASQTVALYPDCATYFSGANSDQHVAVHADLNSSYPVEAAVAAGMSFGMAMWLELVIHVVAVEIYLKLTPAEAERLRNVSLERQAEAGTKPIEWNHTGSSSMTVKPAGSPAK